MSTDAQVPVIVGHEPVLPPRVGDHAESISPEILDVFRGSYVVDVADAVGPLYTMDSGIRPLYGPPPLLLGTALTVKAVPGDNLAVHGALSSVQEGDILVVDWRGYSGGGALGAGSLVAPVLNGLRGLLVDGAFRDVEEVRSLEIPLFGRAINPTSPPKSQVGEINVPVACGGVIVEPGDLVMATPEGAVVVPRADVERVASVLAPYVAPKTLDDWPHDERRRKSAARAAQYQAILAGKRARTS